VIGSELKESGGEIKPMCACPNGGKNAKNNGAVPDLSAAPINAVPCRAYQLAAAVHQHVGPLRGVNPIHGLLSLCRDYMR
jgi:hypothetical protein